jgi:hypothetical protein
MPLVFNVVVVTVPREVNTFNVLSPLPVREMALKFRVILAPLAAVAATALSPLLRFRPEKD